MNQLTKDQLDCLARAAAFMLASPNRSEGIVTIVSEVIGEDVVGSIFADRPIEALNISVVYTFLECVLSLADRAERCDCDLCQRYLAKIATIRQAMNPN